VAIRVLDYDPLPAMGFAERSKEEVLFMGDDLLISPDSQTQLNFRREGQETIKWYSEGDLADQINNILSGALETHKNVWSKLPAAKQAEIAEQIAQKKERLMEVLKNQTEVITSDKINAILQTAFTT
jgi:hypothetical protein